MVESLGDQKRNLTHEVGECILAWAYVEQTLTSIFATMFRPHFAQAAFTFDSVVSLDARRSMISACLKYRSEDEKPVITAAHLAVWKKLSEKVREKYVKRNEVAHGGLRAASNDNQEMWYALVGFATTTREIFSTEALSLKELKERGDSFRTLGEELWSFVMEIDKSLGQLPISPEQPPSNS
jgi:hypothetical protein